MVIALTNGEIETIKASLITDKVYLKRKVANPMSKSMGNYYAERLEEVVDIIEKLESLDIMEGIYKI